MHYSIDPSLNFSLSLSLSQVLSFLKGVLTHLVPLEIWGSIENRAVFFQHLRVFIDLRRWETVNMEMMVQGLKVRFVCVCVCVCDDDDDTEDNSEVNDLILSLQLSHCHWLKCPSPTENGRPHPPSAHLLHKFLLWLMEEVVVRLIRVRMGLGDDGVGINASGKGITDEIMSFKVE